MPTFRRITIRATVETAPMLLQDDQVEPALGELTERLERLDLRVLSIEPDEPPASEPGEAGDDPWSVRGQPVE